MSQIIFISLVIVVFFGANWANVTKSLISGQECQLRDNACFFSNDDMELSIEFMQAPVVEEELTLNFTFSDNVLVQGAWIEGVNMYMGKTPVIINTLNYRSPLTGITFLGSCSQASMQWRLMLEVKTKEAEKTFIYSASFTTHNEQ